MKHPHLWPLYIILCLAAAILGGFVFGWLMKFLS
jgi:hypothetical protein